MGGLPGQARPAPGRAMGQRSRCEIGPPLSPVNAREGAFAGRLRQDYGGLACRRGPPRAYSRGFSESNPRMSASRFSAGLVTAALLCTPALCTPALAQTAPAAPQAPAATAGAPAAAAPAADAVVARVNG